MSNEQTGAGGTIAILLCAILWSTSGLFIKLLDWNPSVIAGGRSFLALILLLFIRVIQNRPEEGNGFLPAGSSVSGLITVMSIIRSAFPSGFWYAATMITFVIANKLTFSANAIILQYTAPVWACLLGWLFLKEKPRRANWVSLALVVAGMLLVFGAKLAGGSRAGDLIALISGITFAANSVALRAYKNSNPLDVMICAHIMCFLYSVPFFFIYPPVFTTGKALSILFMGFFQIGAASALFVYGIRRVRAVQAMLTSSIEPVLNPLWVLIVTGEIPPLSVIFGGAVIVAAILFSSISKSA
jgi:drug/metabolite transporter (DMT)-like permease